MKYIDAQKYISDNQTLIGTTNPKGFVINELIAVPSDKMCQKQFIEQLVLGTTTVLVSPEQYDMDFQVWAIDTAHLQKAQILFYDVIAR